MTSKFLISALPLAAALLAPVPAQAMSDSDGRAVAACRAEMLSRFGAGEVRIWRVGEIAGTSRNIRVTLYVNADRRYTFTCATDGQGQIVTASMDPARGAARQLAGGGR